MGGRSGGKVKGRKTKSFSDFFCVGLLPKYLQQAGLSQARNQEFNPGLLQGLLSSKQGDPVCMSVHESLNHFGTISRFLRKI